MIKYFGRCLKFEFLSFQRISGRCRFLIKKGLSNNLKILFTNHSLKLRINTCSLHNSYKNKLNYL